MPKARGGGKREGVQSEVETGWKHGRWMDDVIWGESALAAHKQNRNFVVRSIFHI